MKRWISIVTLLFLALTIVGCISLPDTQAGFFYMKNGKKYPCEVGDSSNSSSSGNCGNDFYRIGTPSGTLVHCTGTSSSAHCDYWNPNPTISASCVPQYAYENLINKGQSWEVASRQEDMNNSSSPLPVTFAATTTKTVTVTDEEQLTLSLSASVDVIATITAGVKDQINHSVSQSVAVSISNSPVLSIPPEKTGYANYGVRVQITSGHLYDKAACEGSKSDWGTDTTYVPIAAGWCLWIDGGQPCPSIE